MSPIKYCVNDVPEKLTATGSNLLWYTAISGGAGSATVPTPSTATAGSTSYFVSQTTTCESNRTEIVVVVNALPVATITASGPTSFCEGNSVTLSATGGDSHNWYKGAAMIGSGPQMETNAAGSYAVAVTDENGCKATSDTMTITVNAPEAITFNYQINSKPWAKGTSVTVCPGDKLQIAAWPLTGSTWAWAGPSGFASDIRNPTFAAVAENTFGTYSATQTDANGCSSTAQFSINKGSCPVTQTIELQQGWNLISTNVRPADSTISALFKGLDVAEIKDMNTFWRTGQPVIFNSLHTITAGEGYLVNMNVAGTLTVVGTPLSIQNSAFNISSGWQLIGCPYPVPAPMAGIFGSKFSEVKNFDGFWMLNGTANSIENLEPGKGYFAK